MGFIKRILFFFIVIFLFFSLTKNIFDYQKKYQLYLEFKNENDAAKKQNIALKTKLLLESDPKEIEKTIRDKLNLTKPGEAVIIIAQPTPTPVVITPTPAPNWKQWWDVYFK